MTALSVRQPYAELIASGRKTLEIRSWPTAHRGPLLIVASSRADLEACRRRGLEAGPLGVAVCVADVVDVRRCGSFGRAELRRRARWEPDGALLAWELTNARRVHPVPIKGRLRLFDVPDKLISLTAGGPTWAR